MRAIRSIKMRRRLLLLTLAIVSIGCQSGTLPDPHDPRDVGNVSPDLLRETLASISDSLLVKVSKGYITTEEYKTLLAKAANELTRDTDLTKVNPPDAWQYAEILRAGGNWEKAEKMLRLAVDYTKVSKDEDRRINDSLRLAQVEAQLGKYEESVALMKSVMDAKPVDSAPILPAIYLEIAPVFRGHGHDGELAELLEQAVTKELETVVDSSSDAGKDFLMARPFHVRNAYKMAAELYRSAGNVAAGERMDALEANSAKDFPHFNRRDAERSSSGA